MRGRSLIPLVVMALLVTPIVFAHTPYGSGGENNRISTAIQFDPPTKSWILYQELHKAGEVEYYKLHLKAGDVFDFSVATPRNEAASFVPDAVVMWPGASGSGNVTSYVEVPTNYGATLIQGVRQGVPEYEPFTPTSFCFVVKYS
jgi:hypothetical protein